MTKARLAEGIFLVRFDTQYELASTFLRVQEHYESSRFRKRVFSLEEYMDWYAGEFGAFTYYQDWSGFNVPSSALRAFYGGKFHPLLKKEERLLRLFKRERKPYYVIGIASEQDVKHELAHAVFFTRPAYRNAVLAAVNHYNTSALRKCLAKMGYHRSVLVDEVQAYLIAPANGRVVSSRALAPLRKELRAIYRKHTADIRLPR